MRLALAIAAALLAPAAAQAWNEVYRDGSVTVTVVRPSNGCGVDFLISSPSDDRHSVVIGYSLEGVYHLGSGLTDRRSKSGTVAIHMGPLTYGGKHTRQSADLMGLMCGSGDWSYGAITFRATNMSAQQRGHEDEVRRREQARQDEIKRKLAEQEAARKRAQAQQEAFKRSEEARKAGNIAAYRRENPRCIVNGTADMAACEDWKRREAEAERQRESQLAQQRQREDVERRAREAQERGDRMSEEYNRMAERSRTDPCGAAAEQARQPMPVVNSTNPQHQKAVEAQRKQAQAAMDAQCAISKGQAPAPAPAAAAPPPAQATRAAQREQALRDLDAALSRGSQAVNETERKTGAMKDENAELQRLLNGR